MCKKNLMWDVKEPIHSSERVGREVLGVVAVLSVVNTGLMLIPVTITEMVILSKYVVIILSFFSLSGGNCSDFDLAGSEILAGLGLECLAEWEDQEYFLLVE